MINILCYGDSNTYGYDPKTGGRYPKDVRWTGVLQSLLGESFNVIEEGCNGRTTVFIDPEEGWKCGLPYLKPCLNTHKPVDIICMMLGTNDLKTFYGASAADIANGAGKLVDTVFEFSKKKGLPMPVVILMSPPEIGEDIEDSYFSYEFDRSAIERSREFPKEYRRVAEEKDCIFFDTAKYAKASKEDSLHLTAEGHRAIAEALAKVITDMYGEETDE